VQEMAATICHLRVMLQRGSGCWRRRNGSSRGR
jgi:hypothetical protein